MVARITNGIASSISQRQQRAQPEHDRDDERSTSTSPRIVTSPEANSSFSTSTSVVTRVTSRPTGLRS